MFYCSVIDFIPKDREGVAELFDPSFLARIFTKFFKFWLFREQICFFSPIVWKLLKVDTLKLLPYSFSANKRDSSIPADFQSLLELFFRQFFANQNSLITQNAFLYLTTCKILLKKWSVSQPFEQMSNFFDCSKIWTDLYLVVDPNKKSFSRFQ